MKKTAIAALLFMMTTATAFAGQVPGTSVFMTPPRGFVPSDRFAGFFNESSASTIMITELSKPYAQVTAEFNDLEGLRAQGMRVLSKSPVTVDGYKAMLVYAEQPAQGTLFRKWLAAIDRSGGTTILVANFPKETAPYQEEIIKTALLGATFQKPVDSSDTLAFSVKAVPPFKVAQIKGQTMVLSPGGQFPVSDERIPYMVLGRAESGNTAVSNQKAFAENHVTTAAGIRDIRVDQTTPIILGGLSGYVTMAQGEGTLAYTPVTIYQVLLFDASGYCAILGVTASKDKNTNIPLFEETAMTFKMKKP